MRYRFSNYTLDLEAGTLVGARGEVRLRRKTFDLLCAFVQEPVHVLSKDKLLDAVWGAVHLHQDSLSQAVSELRRALGDDAKTPRFIETVHGRGYRFICRVTVDEPAVAEQEAGTSNRTSNQEAGTTRQGAPIQEAGTSSRTPEQAEQSGGTSNNPSRNQEGGTSASGIPRLLAGLTILLLGLGVIYVTRTETAAGNATADASTGALAGQAERPLLRLVLLDLVDSGVGEPSWLVTAVPALLGSQLARHRDVYVYPRSRLLTMQTDLVLDAERMLAPQSDDLRAIHRYLDADVVVAGSVRGLTAPEKAAARSEITLQVFDAPSGRSTLTRTVSPFHEDLGWQLQRLGDEVADHLDLADLADGRASSRRQGTRPTPPLGPAEQYFTAIRLAEADPSRALELLRAAGQQGRLARIAAAERDILLRLGDRAGALEAAREARNLSRGHAEEVVHDLLAGRADDAIGRLHRAERGTEQRDLELWLRVLESLVRARDLGRAFAVLDELAFSVDGPLARVPLTGPVARSAWLEAEFAWLEARAAALAGDTARQAEAARRAAEAATARGQRHVLEQARSLESPSPESKALEQDARQGERRE